MMPVDGSSRKRCSVRCPGGHDLDSDYFERCAAGIPALLQGGRQAATYRGPLSSDPETLVKITAPVLLLQGELTQLNTSYTDTVHHVAAHVIDPHVRQPLPGLGHLGPLLEQGRIAEELRSFFESVRRPT